VAQVSDARPSTTVPAAAHRRPADHRPDMPDFHRPSRRLARLGLAVALATALAGCGGDGAGGGGKGASSPSEAVENGGTVVIATPADPGTLFPPLAVGIQADVVLDQLFDRLAEIGDSLNVTGDRGFEPRLARRWTWARDSLSIAFTIDSAARWHDGQPVRAADVKFTFDLYTDPAVGAHKAPLLGNIDSVSVQDSLTAVFWFKRRGSQQFLDATYHMRVLPRHLLDSVPPARLATSAFAKSPVGTGRFRFRAWVPGQRVEIAADPNNYRGRAHLDRVVWSIAPDFAATTIQLLTGGADFLEQLPPDAIKQVLPNGSLRVVPYQGLSYAFLQFNLHAADGSTRPHPLFADRELRRALTMAVDRQRITSVVYDSLALPGAGPFSRLVFKGWEQLRQVPHDVAAARALLDSLGWRVSGADTVRVKNGTRLAFTILAPTSSATRRRAAVLLQNELRAVGADVQVEQLEITAFGERQRAHKFDATMSAWTTDPTPSGLRQTWTTIGARAPGGSNFGAYESPAFDAAVDSALAASDQRRADAHWLRAFQTIVDDAPGIWLYEPLSVAGAHRRIRLAPLRPDEWWAHLADWWIPSRDRIGRDRVGLR
jgi:peptide/nickel transport system substrate-binding protein